MNWSWIDGFGSGHFCQLLLRLGISHANMRYCRKEGGLNGSLSTGCWCLMTVRAWGRERERDRETERVRGNHLLVVTSCLPVNICAWISHVLLTGSSYISSLCHFYFYLVLNPRISKANIFCRLRPGPQRYKRSPGPRSDWHRERSIRARVFRLGFRPSETKPCNVSSNFLYVIILWSLCFPIYIPNNTYIIIHHII